jgi:hypothetical protein
MTDTQLTDQKGIGFITQTFANIGCAFSEYKREIGIDGIVEIREAAYKSSGKIFALQLKSGESYFANESNDAYAIYMDEEHIDYWQKCILPVMFIIYSPQQNQAYWTKIDKSLLIKTTKNYKIVIPKDNVLSKVEKDQLYSLFYGKLYNDAENFKKIFSELVDLKNDENLDVCVRGIELFINGLTDTCNQLYFNTDVYCEIIEKKLNGKNQGRFNLPPDVFYTGYFKIINYHNLIEGNFAFEIETLNNRKLFPFFLKPFTLNGLRFLEYLNSLGIAIHDYIFISGTGNYDPWTFKQNGNGASPDLLYF